MAIVQNSNNGGPSFNIHYSAFLGMLFVSNEQNNAAIEEIKGVITDAEVRKGYTGNSGSTAKARGLLKDKGVTPVTQVTGRLSSAYLRDVPTSGGSTAPYLNVVLRDDDGTYYISAPLGSSGAQMLARKLVNAEIGVQTEINLFATYEKSENPQYQGRYFASHGASLKQNDAQIPVASADALKAIIDQTLAALKNANMTDPKILNTARSTAVLDYHVGLMKAFEAKTEAYYAENKGEKAQAQAAVEKAPAPAPAPAGGFDDFEDDIPF